MGEGGREGGMDGCSKGGRVKGGRVKGGRVSVWEREPEKVQGCACVCVCNRELGRECTRAGGGGEGVCVCMYGCVRKLPG